MDRGWRRATGLALACLALALAGCGDAEEEPGPPTSIPAPPEHTRGADALADAGCLGCHRIGAHGNAGPGPDLSRIGARMGAREIERALIDPVPPMPSYSVFREREPRAFDAMVRYLASLE